MNADIVSQKHAVVVGAGMAGLLAASAVKIRRNPDIWFHDAIGPTPIHDIGLLTPSVTRPLLQQVSRQRVLGLPNVHLREAIADGLDSNLAARYFDGCNTLNGVGWSVMETRDFAYDCTSGERPADLVDRWRAALAIRRLAEVDAEVHALSVRVTHLLEPPSALARPDIVERANKLG